MNRVGASNSIRSPPANTETDSNFFRRPPPATLAMDGPAESVHAAGNQRSREADAPGQVVVAAPRANGRPKRPPPVIIHQK